MTTGDLHLAIPQHAAGRGGTGLAVPGLILAAAATALLGVALNVPEPGAQVTLGAWALAAYCSALLCLTASVVGLGGLGLAGWKIGPWSLAWAAVAFGLATLSWTGTEGDAAQILPSAILRALWAIAVAMTALAAGYCAGPPGPAARAAARVMTTLSSRRTNDIRSAAVPWALFATGTAAQAASAAATGRFGFVGDASSAVTTASGYGQLLGVVAACGPLSIAVAAIRAYGTRASGTRLTLGVLLTAEIALAGISGGKQGFIVAVLAVLIPRAAVRKRVSPLVVAFAAAFFLLIVIPFTYAYRTNARGTVTLSTGQAVSAAPAIARQVLDGDRSPSVAGTSLDYLAQRIREIDSMAIVLQRTPAQFPYLSPAQLGEAPLADLIPRAIWHGKPILAVGYEFGQQYYGLPPSVYSSSAVTPEGDLYRHGGWIPLVAGMLLLGCGIRMLDNVLDVRASAHAALLVILLFPELVKAENDWVTLLAGIPAEIILWLAVVHFSFARRAVAPG
jgi:hypothetical protein